MYRLPFSRPRQTPQKCLFATFATACHASFLRPFQYKTSGSVAGLAQSAAAVLNRQHVGHPLGDCFYRLLLSVIAILPVQISPISTAQLPPSPKRPLGLIQPQQTPHTAAAAAALFWCCLWHAFPFPNAFMLPVPMTGRQLRAVTVAAVDAVTCRSPKQQSRPRLLHVFLANFSMPVPYPPERTLRVPQSDRAPKNKARFPPDKEARYSPPSHILKNMSRSCGLTAKSSCLEFASCIPGPDLDHHRTLLQRGYLDSRRPHYLVIKVVLGSDNLTLLPVPPRTMPVPSLRSLRGRPMLSRRFRPGPFRLCASP